MLDPDVVGLAKELDRLPLALATAGAYLDQVAISLSDYLRLNPHNLIFSDEMDIVALLDWAWARIVPLQFFNPSRWLTGMTSSAVSIPFVYSYYTAKMHKLRDATRARELAQHGEELLSKDLEGVEENGGILVASALENCTEIHDFAHALFRGFLVTYTE